MARLAHQISILNMLLLLSCVSLYVMWPMINNNPEEMVTDASTQQALSSNLNHNNNISCENPTHIMFRYGGTLNNEILSSFAQHGFNQNCSYTKSRLICQQYNNRWSKYYCNGGRLAFAMNYFNKVKHGLHVGSKVSLHRILSLYCNTFSNASNNICDFVSLTYEINDTNQRIEFLSKQIDCTNKYPQYTKTWVFKENKHQGSGVHFFNNHQWIYRLLFPNRTEQLRYYPKCEHIKPLSGDKGKDFLQGHKFSLERVSRPDRGLRVRWDGLLMQQFISNPLLIDNKAFHVRAVYLIPSFSPFVVLLYPDGVLFRSYGDFDGKLSNRIALRSNGHVQRESKLAFAGSSFEKFWGYRRFQRYLDEVYGEKLFNYTTQKLPNDLKHIAKHVFNANAYYNQMNNLTYMVYNGTEMYHNNIDLNWNIFCMDVVITSNFQLKLLEINGGNCGLVCGEVIPLMSNDGYPWWCSEFGNDAGQILLEIYQKKIDNVPITKIDSLGRFDIVYLEQ